MNFGSPLFVDQLSIASDFDIDPLLYPPEVEELLTGRPNERSLASAPENKTFHGRLMPNGSAVASRSCH